MQNKIIVICFLIIFIIYYFAKVILEGFSNNSNLKCEKYPYLCSNKTKEEQSRQYKIETLAYPFSKKSHHPDTYYWASKT